MPLPTIFYWILELFRQCGMFGEVVRSWGIGKEKKRYNKTSNFNKGLNGYGV